MSWPLQDAKNKFSAVVDAALAGAPQTVTRRGAPVAVVISVAEYERLRAASRAHAPGFVEHLLAMPQGGPDEEAERLRSRPREINL